MTRSTLRRGVALPAVAALALALAACGAANESGGGTGGGDSGLSGEIAGAGASSQQSAQEAWVAGFTGENSGVTVNYDPVGSGGGREQFIAGAVQFAGTDSYLDEEELTQAQEQCGGTVVEVPIYVSPIAVAFNLDGVDSLNLTPSVVARIFNRQITNWNDPAIAADNPDATLPDLAITPVNRSDESGTTENFAEYLVATAGTDWPYEAGDVWPVSGGEAAQGTSGVVSAINGGQGTIGYADASQVRGLGLVAVQVGDQFVEYSPEAAAAVLEESPRVEGSPDTVFAYDLARDTTAEGTYPIVLVSYLLACGSYDDQNVADLVRAYLTYMASEAGQTAAAGNAGSAPISQSLRDEIQPAIDGIGSGS